MPGRLSFPPANLLIMFDFIPAQPVQHVTPPRTPRRIGQRPRSRGRAGFTLNEVLVALGILSIGITAVAALFPSAILLQKRAVKDALFQQNTRSAEALLKAKGIQAEVLFNFSDNISGEDSGGTNIFPAYTARVGQVAEPELDVYALSEVDTFFVSGNPATNNFRTDMRKGSYGPGGVNADYETAESLLQDWPEVDRSFPSIETNPADREFFYVPLFRRGPQATPYINDWIVYAFVMQAQPEVEDPAAGFKYPNDPAAVPDGSICANPFDNEDYFPKVFRVEVTNWVGNNATIDVPNVSNILRLGNLVLGDDGEIYRVGEINGNVVTLNVENRQTLDTITLGGTSLTAIWFAMPPNSTEANPPSPIRDIRVLSRGTVKLDDYQ